MKKILCFLSLAGGFATAVSALFYKVFLYTDFKKFSSGDVAKKRKWLKNTEYEERYISARDGIILHGITAKNSGSRWVVIMHGYDSEGKNMADCAERFYAQGFNILLPDQRGYGLSEGHRTSMGEKEQYDLIEWIKRVISDENASEIVLYGVSMGAATVMLTAGHKLPEQVRVIIEDCGYTSVYDEFKYNLKRMFHLPAFPILDIVDFLCRFRDGWSLKTGASCINAVKRAKLPILFIHGSADEFVPFYMHDELYSAAVCKKEKLVIYGAVHAQSSEADPQLYWNTVFDFIERNR